LPKGTVLFHGFQGDYRGIFDDSKLISELFGDIFDGAHCVSKHTQKFFYPAPFMGDVVYKYQVYGIYILNYDVNLVIMILPDKSLHADKGSFESTTIRCADIAENDECGMKYKGADHCLTPVLLKEHPDIHGYIAIPNVDGALYKSMFFSQLKDSYPNFVSMTTPMVVSNSKGLVAIPEIVLHPYHVRTEAPRYVSPRAVDDPVSYTLSNISQLNYIPIAFFTETDTYSFLDLRHKKHRYTLLTSERHLDQTAITPLQQRLKIFVDQALSPAGVKVQDMLLKFTIDLRTGFYCAKYLVVPESNNEIANIKVFKETDEGVNYEEYDIVPFSYPTYLKKRIHRLLTHAEKHPGDETSLSRELSRIKASYRRKYIFDKGKALRTFDLERSFQVHHLRNQTRKKEYPKSYKRTKTMKRPRPTHSL
jgi:hypothetical protein